VDRGLVDRTKISARLLTLLKGASIEVTARSDDQIGVLKEFYHRGMDVHVTALPNDPRPLTIAMARHLVDAGFNPVPHLTARGFESHSELEQFLAGASDAGVRRMLVISGDVPRPAGPFPDSISVLRTDLLQRHGITAIGVAGHPEGHPAASAEVMEKALQDKVAYAKEHGISVDVITQFLFEAEPVVNYLDRLKALGIDAPLRVGITGPAKLTTLIKYAMHCGVGNSLRALRKQAGNITKLAQDAPPDELLEDIVRETGGRVAGFHFYIFGGLRKTGQWLNSAMERLAAESR
jgi:methylenetetrahydrofolate reductase (NADPH)